MVTPQDEWEIEALVASWRRGEQQRAWDGIMRTKASRVRQAMQGATVLLSTTPEPQAPAVWIFDEEEGEA